MENLIISLHEAIAQSDSWNWINPAIRELVPEVLTDTDAFIPATLKAFDQIGLSVEEIRKLHKYVIFYDAKTIDPHGLAFIHELNKKYDILLEWPGHFTGTFGVAYDRNINGCFMRSTLVSSNFINGKAVFQHEYNKINLNN